MELKRLNETIKSLGFDKPSDVQEKTYEAFLRHESSIIISPTGSGKTHAYLIPILENINQEKDEIQAVIVVPTNELVIQVENFLKSFNSDISYKTLSAKDDRKRTIDSFIHLQPQIIIATPGRLNDLVIKAGVVKIQTAKYLILDEADMLFDFDFMSQLDPIVLRFKGLAYIFSATMPNNLYSWIRKYFTLFNVIDLSKDYELDIDHYLIKAGLDKNYRLLELLETINPYLSLIFVSKNEDIEPLFELLNEKEYKVARLSSTQPIRQRKTIIDEIKQLKYQYVIASDIMARGMDFIGISHIINYDLPFKIEFYIHRSGRTGRMGAHGEVYSFYEDKFSRKIEVLKKRGISFKFVKIRDKTLIVEEPKKKSLTEEEFQEIRKIKKPTKVKPGYRKKNKKKIKKALQNIRYKKGEK